MSEWLRVFRNGVSLENPLTVLMIGLCATLAVSTQFEGALFMGLAVVFVLTMSNIVVSAVRKFIPGKVRIPIFIVVIASFVTIADLTMHAFVPAAYAFLGIWIPLIVVNCIILGRAEAFAYHNPVHLAIADGLGMGVGYVVVIALMAFIRELFGTGAIVFMDHTLISMPAGYEGPSILVLFPGAFILFGFVIAGSLAINRRLHEREHSRTTAPTGCAREVG